MKLLLDTHVVLWWFGNSPRIKRAWSDAISDPRVQVLVSVVSLLEIVLKIRAGKLGVSLAGIEHLIERNNFALLSISLRHLHRLGALPRHHNDPFDNLLIAQAIDEDAHLVTIDAAMALYPVKLL